MKKNVYHFIVYASSLNRSKVPGEEPENTASIATTTPSTSDDDVYEASSVLRRSWQSSLSLSPFHQVSLSGDRTSSPPLGEPDKSINRNDITAAQPLPRPQPSQLPPTIIEEDIATDLEEVLSFNPPTITIIIVKATQSHCTKITQKVSFLSSLLTNSAGSNITLREANITLWEANIQHFVPTNETFVFNYQHCDIHSSPLIFYISLCVSLEPIQAETPMGHLSCQKVDQ